MRPAAAGECTHATLESFDADVGDVLSRIPLPDTRTQVFEEVVGTEEAPCVDGESDEACTVRVEGLNEHLSREGQRLRVTIESDTRRVRAVLLEEGPETERFFPDFDALADYMEQRIDAGHKVVLYTAGEVPDPATRKAVITLIEERTDIATVGAGMTLRIRLDDSHLAALTALESAAAQQAITVLSWQADDEGIVSVDLRCPSP